jgi:hypothetical protein
MNHLKFFKIYIVTPPCYICDFNFSTKKIIINKTTYWRWILTISQKVTFFRHILLDRSTYLVDENFKVKSFNKRLNLNHSKTEEKGTFSWQIKINLIDRCFLFSNYVVDDISSISKKNSFLFDQFCFTQKLK